MFYKRGLAVPRVFKRRMRTKILAEDCYLLLVSKKHVYPSEVFLLDVLILVGTHSVKSTCSTAAASIWQVDQVNFAGLLLTQVYADRLWRRCEMNPVFPSTDPEHHHCLSLPRLELWLLWSLQSNIPANLVLESSVQRRLLKKRHRQGYMGRSFEISTGKRHRKMCFIWKITLPLNFFGTTGKKSIKNNSSVMRSVRVQ